jgi:hypothetical protein
MLFQLGFPGIKQKRECAMEKEEIQRSMYKVYCRSFQNTMKAANYFMGYRMPEYLEGPGSILRLASLIKEKGTGKILVVTDANLMKMGLLDPMLKFI